MRYRRSRRLTTAALIAVCGAVGFAGSRTHHTPSTPALTAGQVALLGNKLDAAAGQGLLEAISSGDPLVRTVAARVAGVSAHPPFADPIATAFGREQDPTAAAEQARALLLVRGPAAVETIEARMASLSTDAVSVYAGWVANNQPERLADLLPKLAIRASEDRSELAPWVPVALKKFEGRQEDSGRLLRAWLTVGTPVSWQSMLSRLSSEAGGAWRDAVLIEALGSKDPAIGDTTAWSLVEWVARNRPVSSAVIDAASRDIPSDASASPTWAALGRELLARHAGKKMPDRTALLTAEAAKHMGDARLMAMLQQVTTNDEKQVLRTVLGKSYPTPGAATPSLPPPAPSAMRTMPALWPGFFKSLIDAAGCKAERSPVFGVTSVVYRPDGRVAKLGVDGTGLKPECIAAMTALARMTVEHSTRKATPGTPEFLVFPIASDYVECVNTDPADVSETAGPMRIGSGRIVEPPRKLRDVKPVYPPALLQQRVTGTVMLDSVISRSGCVSGVSVLRGVAPAMDLAAVRAVSGWVFTPTVVDGKPVPVIMTVVVTFGIG